MRTLLIAAVALTGLTASVANAQVTTTVRNGGGNWGGGARTGGGWSGGQTNVRVNTSQSHGQWQGQSQGGSWSGSQSGGQWRGGSQWQGNGQGGNWQGGPRVGGDPRTWGPGNQPKDWNGPRPGNPGTWTPPKPPHGGQWNGGGNWSGGGWGGGYSGGRWNAGTRAPGGWGAYRRPDRGWTMPGYWRSNDYRINNWGWFGLQAPPSGYGWSRYYDDAVLVDDYGRVYDSVGGLDWSGYDNGSYPSQGYANAPDAYYGSDPRCYQRKKGSGIGGAILGGAIGAGIGAATGGLGTALIAGGGGALLGQQIDRESRGRVVCEDGPGRSGGYPQGGYDQGYAGQSAYAGDGYAYAQGGQGGYSYGYQGYGYAPGVTATATVEFDAPVTTTTTTTTVTEEWVYPKKTWRKPVRKWVPKRKTKLIRCEC